MRTVLKDVVRVRMKNSGSDRDVALLVEKSYKKPAIRREIPVTQRETPLNSNSNQEHEKNSLLSDRSVNFTAPFRDKLNEHMKAFSENIPFIDEDSDIVIADEAQTEGTLDDHLMASLQIVKNDSATGKAVDTPQNTRYKTPASDEWSFVREGLEKKYGNKYFEGPRPDFLEEQQIERTVNNRNEPYFVHQTANRDSGYQTFRHIGAVDAPMNAYDNTSPYILDSGYQTDAPSIFTCLHAACCYLQSATCQPIFQAVQAF